MLITLSGLDGAGKSTLLGAVTVLLQRRGYRVARLTVYDDIALYALFRRARDRLSRRSGAARRPAERAPGSGGLSRPLYALARSSAARRTSFFGDLLILIAYRIYHELLHRRVLLVDRYVYDSLADIADGRHWLFIRAFLAITPTPDVPIFVDVAPDRAFRRKGEYSVDYLTRRRQLYETIFGWVKGSVRIPNDDVDEAVRQIEAIAVERMR